MRMRKYVLIGCGGFLGAILRYLIKGIDIFNHQMTFPLATLIINLSGTFLLALFLTAAFEVWEMDPDLRLGVATGLLGAYTTFSTLCKETDELLLSGNYLSAAAYIAVSIMLGLASAFLGIAAARKTAAKLVKSKEKASDIIERDVE